MALLNYQFRVKELSVGLHINLIMPHNMPHSMSEHVYWSFYCAHVINSINIHLFPEHQSIPNDDTVAVSCLYCTTALVFVFKELMGRFKWSLPLCKAIAGK